MRAGGDEPLSSGAEREERDLGRAVEPEGDANGAEAAIDVKLQISKAEPALDILAAELGQSHGTDQRQANLAAVGVAG